MQALQSHRATFEMIVAMLISGSIGIFVTESGQSAFNVVFFRCSIACICLLPYCYFRGFLKAEFFKPRILLIVGAGGACIVFNWVFLFKAYALTSISVATLVYHVNPFIILGMGALFFGERITSHDLLWTIIGFAGLYLIVDPGFSSSADVSGHLSGIGLVLLATTLYSFTVMLTKMAGAIPSPVIILIQALLGSFLLLPFTTLEEVPLVGEHWIYLVSLGVVHTFLLYSMLFSAYQKLSMVMIAILSFIYPLSTVLFDYLVYDRVLNLPQSIGITLIIFATLAVKLRWSLPLRPLTQT